MFSGTTFSGKNVIFEGAEFTSALAHFNGVKFTAGEKISFMISKFFKGVDFSLTEFSARQIAFSRAELYGYSHFNQAKFLDYEYLYFNDVKFHESGERKPGNVNFFKAEFNGNNLDFRKSELFVSLTFSEVNCSAKGIIDFTEVIFHKAVSFSNTHFVGEVRFINCTFNNATFFNFTIFHEPQKVFFRTDNLSYVSFANTDVTRIIFSDKVMFSESSKDRFKTLDERRMEERVRSKSNEIIPSFGSVLTIYRNLRENFEFNLRYEEAGLCFIREMDLKRIFSEKGKAHVCFNNKLKTSLFSFTAIYLLLAKYGESVGRPIYFGLLVFSISLFFWLMQLNPMTSQPSIFDISGLSMLHNRTHIDISIARTFTDFIPFLPMQIEQASSSDYVIKIFGTLAFGLSLLSLRRKFERRFRH